jgi:cell division protease FtsH
MASVVARVVFAFLLFSAVQLYCVPRAGGRPSIAYSEFKESVLAGHVATVVISGTVIRGTFKNGARDGSEPVGFETLRVEDPELFEQLYERDVEIRGASEGSSSVWLLTWVLPLALLLPLWFFLLRGTQRGRGMMAVGQSRAKVYVQSGSPVSFSDVAGVDEAKEELEESIEFLKTPERFERLGGKIPKGVLLVGPPGTGKTLLARAVAGEASVPFFSISGSEFVEMFVGVGASRVRDLFLQAKRRAPCIIFVDELDAIGRARGMGPMIHEEREQTLNQILVEMDGFDASTGVIIIAATNRPEVLDPALLRAGRFDRQVLVDRPYKAGRVAILEVHSKGVSIDGEVNFETLASMTVGFVGADLANVVNEAALLAVRRDKLHVGMAEFEEAIERIVGGLEKKNRILSSYEKERVAHHEVGHALLAVQLGGDHGLHKISIVPRGISALGYTLQLPTEERFLMTKAELEDKIAVLLGGRVAEEIVYGDTSTGARDDLLKATAIAQLMVKSYGMSPEMGQLSLEDARSGEPWGASLAPVHNYSPETAREIDSEVRRILHEQYERASLKLSASEHLLRALAQTLQDKETLTGAEFEDQIATEGSRDSRHEETGLRARARVPAMGAEFLPPSE